MTDSRTLILEADDTGGRLDRVVARLAPDLSRARIQALIRQGALARSGAILDDPSAKVRADWQELVLTIPEAAEPEPLGEAIALSVVHEDAELIVIDKPAGLVVHPAAGHDSGTLVNALIAHCGDSLSGIGGVKRPGIVHRLDKDTSGLLVVAKTDRAHRHLAAQFADHGRSGPLERAYLAFVWGGFARTQATYDLPLARDPRNREKIAVVKAYVRAERDIGKEAITHVERLALYPPAEGRHEASLLRCTLETGRTHQIRVHLTHAGHPLMGDNLYGTGFKTKIARLPAEARAALEALGRQALHAAVLGFEHPATGRTLRFESALPADLQRLKAALESLT